MAFNFAPLLSAACGGAPHRLRRLRRPWRRAVVRARPSVWFSWGARLVSLDLYRISTLVAKLRNRKWRLILRTCCPPPAAALRAAYARRARVFSLFFCLFHSVILPKKCHFLAKFQEQADGRELTIKGVDPELTRGCAPGPPARLQRVDKCYHQQRRRI